MEQVIRRRAGAAACGRVPLEILRSTRRPASQISAIYSGNGSATPLSTSPARLGKEACAPLKRAGKARPAPAAPSGCAWTPFQESLIDWQSLLATCDERAAVVWAHTRVFRDSPATQIAKRTISGVASPTCALLRKINWVPVSAQYLRGRADWDVSSGDGDVPRRKRLAAGRDKLIYDRRMT